MCSLSCPPAAANGAVEPKRHGIIIRVYQRRCPAFAANGARCRCEPSWRARRWNPWTKRMEWQKPVAKERDEVLSWLAAARKAAPHLKELAAAGSDAGISRRS